LKIILNQAVRGRIPFEEELHKNVSADDSIQPEVMRTATGVKRFKNSERVSIKINNSLSVKKKIASINKVEK